MTDKPFRGPSAPHPTRPFGQHMRESYGSNDCRPAFAQEHEWTLCFRHHTARGGKGLIVDGERVAASSLRKHVGRFPRPTRPRSGPRGRSPGRARSFAPVTSGWSPPPHRQPIPKGPELDHHVPGRCHRRMISSSPVPARHRLHRNSETLRGTISRRARHHRSCRSVAGPSSLLVTPTRLGSNGAPG